MEIIGDEKLYLFILWDFLNQIFGDCNDYCCKSTFFWIEKYFVRNKNCHNFVFLQI